MSFNRSRNPFPCTPDCPERTPGCHGKCEKYLIVRKKLDEYNAERAKQQSLDYYICGRTIDKRDSYAKRKRSFPTNKFYR